LPKCAAVHRERLDLEELVRSKAKAQQGKPGTFGDLNSVSFSSLWQNAVDRGEEVFNCHYLLLGFHRRETQQLVNLLLRYGADETIRNKHGMTAKQNAQMTELLQPLVGMIDFIQLAERDDKFGASFSSITNL
jgi:hypothetical protein